MGFLTRLLAGLLAASTLGTGLAGTANAVDVTGATGTTKSVVKLTADGGNETSEDTADNPDDDSTDADSTTDAGAQSDAGQQAEIQSSTSQDKATAKSSLPDHIVNGSFDYPACPDGKNSCDVDPTTGWGGFYVDYGRKFMPIPDWNRSKFGWDSSQEGLRPDQQPNSHQKLQYCVQIGNKPNNNGQKMNRFAEIIAETPDEYIYQDIATTPGVMYRWSLKHASEDASHVDSMQVTIGSPGKETAQDATRTTSNGRGDRTGVTSKTIATKGGQAEWETYTGVYIATSTVTRFTFKSAQGRDSTRGNFIDDVMFTKAYKLTYDKNSADASGQVPSNQRGKENTTQPAKNKTNGKIRLASDTSKLSDHLVNSDFEYLPDGGWKTVDAPSYMRNAYTSVDPNNGQYMRNAKHVDADLASWVDWPGFDQSKFAWKTDQKGGHDQGGLKDRAEAVELQQDSTDGNTYAEMVASETGRTIYQNLATIPGTLYKIRLKHASLCKDNVDKMQVVINGTPIEMTRVTANGKAGDKVGEKSTTIATKVTNENRWHHADQWETYEGYYVIPDGQTTTRFGFKAVNYLDPTKGNLLDDVTFARAYKLSYDKNSTDATGEVPSNQRGKENTTQPAKTKTNGTVKTLADRTASGLTVHDLKKGDIAPAQYGDFKFSTTDDFTAEQVTDVNGFTVKKNWDPTEENQAYAGILATMYQPNKNGASLVLHHVGQWRDSSGTQRWLNAKITVNDQNLGSLVYLESKHEFRASYGKWDKHPSSRPYMDVTVDFLLDDGSTPQGLRGVTGFTDLDGGTSGYNEGVELVSGFDGAYVRSDAHLARFGTNGWAGTTDENKNNADAHGMKHYVGATFTGSSFHVRWSVASGQARQSGFQPVDSTIAYRLTYNKNAQDASGQVPSNETANTVKQAKAKSSGSVRFAADKTDGKVSDLVQRTTTHEDGSVTVRTVDQSTDVVSGCQVYYPAGQRITLATMAKDDDCWDSSMLSRPGHTQLGWNQDRNATQAQAQVTMVEGGMTVYAVWVGNPVLTYDTNKPSTWTGEMPSTPASISVPYNTAAADGSGWRAGDVSKIRGYKFLGWYTGPQDNGLYDWTRPLTGNVTVYAHWQRLQANVIYDKNASDAKGSHANTTGWQYSDVTIPGDTSKSFKRDKYVFKGWGTKPGKADVVYKDGSKVALQDKDITLYAQWQEVHENFVPTGGIGLPIAIAGGVLLLMFGIGSTVMLTRRMNGHGMPDNE